MHFNVYYVLSSQNSSYTLNCILLVMYIHVMDLITAHKMEHTKISFEYYSPALTHVLSPTSLLPPIVIALSFQEGKILHAFQTCDFFNIF